MAENAMRPLALGRRNRIHVGSKEAGPRVAAIISIVETCRRLSLPLRDYLGSVLPDLGQFPDQSRSLNSRPALGRPGSNRRNPEAPANLSLSDVYKDGFDKLEVSLLFLNTRYSQYRKQTFSP
jgi:hypothetical protein